MFTVYNPVNDKVVAQAPGHLFAETLIGRIESAGKHVAELMFDNTDEFEARVGNYPLESISGDGSARAQCD